MYLGRSPTIGTQRLLDSIESQFNGALTAFDLRYGGVPTYPTLSAGLLVSLGGVLQEPSEAYYVSSDKIVFSAAPQAGTECWILLYSEFGSAQSRAGEAAIAATGEPMGFENRTHSTISFASNTRTFSIGPNSAAGHSSYMVWTKGTKRTISAALSVQIGTTTGLYYIYFDAFGDLQSKTTYFTWDTETPVAYVYWNATTSTAPFVADERHGIVLDWATHEYLHRTRGAVIAEGFSISAYTTTGNGSADAHAQFDLGNGTFFDEDLEVAISHSASPTVGTFTQVLTGAAEIPVFYLSGSSGAWVRDTPTEYACKQSATTLQYNLLTGSTWSTTPATNNRYVVSWVVATNEITAPIIAILGQGQYTAIGSAEAARFGDLVLTNFPVVEFRPLWKVIFQTSTSFTNAPNALVANVLDLRQLSETGEAGSVVSDHGLLSGLADDDHAQYLHTTLDRTGVTSSISTTGAVSAASLSTGTSGVGVNINNAGLISGPATITLDPAAVGDDTGLVRIKGGLEVHGNFTAALTGAASSNVLKAGDTMTGALVVPLGAFGTPSLTFTGDLNTGIFSPGADQLAISTNGTVKLTIGSLDGNPVIENNFPTIRPTLDLAFAATKRLDPRVTFTRASSGTFVGGNGLIKTAGVNEARFDHDPVTGESLGLLIEESRTNIRTYSILFDYGVSVALFGNWNYASTLSYTAAIAPDGTLTANRFRPISPSGTLMQRFSATAGVTYTISMYLKLDPESPSNANIERFGFMVAWSNNGSTLTSYASSPSIGVQLTNEWKRFSFSYTLPAGAISMEMGPSNQNSGTGDPNYSVLAWGWQIEQGAFPTSYIPTAGSTVTRASDFALITGKNFSDFYRQDEGTFIGEWFTNGSVNNQPFLLEASDSGRNIILYMIRGGTGNGRVGQNGATVGGDFDFQNLGVLADNQKAKLGLAYKKNDAAGIMNGGTVSTDNQTGTITPDRLSIGNLGNVSSDYQPNGCIKRITYYPKRLSNAQLQALTT